MLSKNQIENECKKLETSIKEMKNFISNSPQGILRCRKNGKYINWYVQKTEIVDGEKVMIETYLSKKEENLARKLLLKSIYNKELRVQIKELKALRAYLKNFGAHNQIEKVINQSAGHAHLLEPIFSRKWDTKTQEWLNKTSMIERPNPEGKVHRCRNGMMVRSKSEQAIVGILDRNNIPFKYEEPITLNFDGRFTTTFPDFTIYQSHNNSEIIWEHFGMMNDPNYRRSCIRKITAYIKNGYTPFEDLIMTFESNNSGVDEMLMESYVNYLLK